MRDILRVLGYLAPYKGRIFLAILASFLSSICLMGFVGLVDPIAKAIFKPAAAPAAAAVPGTSAAASPGTTATPPPSPSPGSDRLATAGRAAEEAKEWLRETRSALEAKVGITRARDWLAASPFTRIPLFLVLLFFLKGIFTYFADYWLKWVGYRTIQDLRLHLFERILGQSARFFSKNPTGLLMSRVMGDVGRLQKIASSNLADSVRLVFTVASMTVFVFYLSWRLSLMCLVAMPLILYPLVRFGQRLKRASRTSQEKAADVSNILNETISGNRIVKAFGMEGFEKSRFKTGLVRMFRSDAKALRVSSVTSPFLELIGAVFGAALFWYAGHNISRGAIDGPGFLLFLTALGYLFVSLKSLSAMNNDLQQAVAAATRVFAMIDEPNEISEAPDAVEMPVFRNEIRFAAVSFRYEDRSVLDAIDLRVPAGEVHALVGGSGAGKTTLVNLIPRFYDVTGGAITIDGMDVRRATLSSLRRQIALVTQETILFNDTVRNNIAYGNGAIPLESVVEAARAAGAHEFIEQIPGGYEAVIGEAGTRLSAGQRQRITIARALLKNAPILILDEATSALDAESEALVQRALEVLMRGRTSIVIAHRLSTIRRADRIHVLGRGRIVESGRHEELLAKGGVYARLHSIQFQDVDAAAD